MRPTTMASVECSDGWLDSTEMVNWNALVSWNQPVLAVVNEGSLSRIVSMSWLDANAT